MDNKNKIQTKTSHPQSIGFIGECMIEISGTLPSSLKLGYAGDTFNTAVYLSRLLNAPGSKVEYLTGLGTDKLSTSVCSFIKSCGVGTTHIRTIEGRRPGLYLIEIAPDGERFFHYWRNEAAAKVFLDNISVDEFTSELLKFKGIYFSGISIAILSEVGKKVLYEALIKAKHEGLKIYFDSNYRPSLWSERMAAVETFEKFVPLADIAMMTDTDLMDLYQIPLEEVSKPLVAFGVPEAVLKRSHKPCEIYHAGNHLSVEACKVSTVVDTTAAGDSFNAAYLTARLIDLPPETAAKWGHLLASQVIQHKGAIIDQDFMPDMSLAEVNP